MKRTLISISGHKSPLHLDNKLPDMILVLNGQAMSQGMFSAEKFSQYLCMIPVMSK